MSSIRPQIEESWYKALQPEFDKPYFQSLVHTLKLEKTKHIIYPKGSHIFEAFNTLPFNEVKVVILGQDPYHGPNQAHGLSFSVNKGVSIPPSLVNIYKELQDDLHITPPNHGFLKPWAAQGVLLLNAILTVRKSEPASHRNIGWAFFTDAVIKTLSDQKEHMVFLLWGAFAQSKKTIIDTHKHTVLESTHPSPFSAHRGFLGSRPFSKANAALKAHNQTPIDWSL